MDKDEDKEWNEAEAEAWCANIRPIVLDYMTRQNVSHGKVGNLPAWHLAPYVSLWAIESLKVPDSVGWWVVCGDLPTDYCSSNQCKHPRIAIQRIAENWKEALDRREPSDETIGSTGIPISLAPLLSSRAATLLEFAQNDALWPAEIRA